MRRYTNIGFDPSTLEKIHEYMKLQNKNQNISVNELIEYGFKYINNDSEYKINNELLNKTLSKIIYSNKLLEQLYSDLEIDNHTNPNNNGSLNKFKTKINKDYFND